MNAEFTCPHCGRKDARSVAPEFRETFGHVPDPHTAYIADIVCDHCRDGFMEYSAIKSQAFIRGDLVHAKKYKSDAVIIGSYNDIFFKGSVSDYGVMLLSNGEPCAWHHSSELVSLGKNIGEAGIRELRANSRIPARSHEPSS